MTLSTVEGSDTDWDSGLKYERGHGRLLVPDQLLCEWVDSEVVPGLGCCSFTQLGGGQATEVQRMLRSQWKITQEQAERCLFNT